MSTNYNTENNSHQKILKSSLKNKLDVNYYQKNEINQNVQRKNSYNLEYDALEASRLPDEQNDDNIIQILEGEQIIKNMNVSNTIKPLSQISTSNKQNSYIGENAHLQESFHTCRSKLNFSTRQDLFKSFKNSQNSQNNPSMIKNINNENQQQQGNIKKISSFIEDDDLILNVQREESKSYSYDFNQNAIQSKISNKNQIPTIDEENQIENSQDVQNQINKFQKKNTNDSSQNNKDLIDITDKQEEKEEIYLQNNNNNDQAYNLINKNSNEQINKVDQNLGIENKESAEILEDFIDKIIQWTKTNLNKLKKKRGSGYIQETQFDQLKKKGNKIRQYEQPKSQWLSQQQQQQIKFNEINQMIVKKENYKIALDNLVKKMKRNTKLQRDLDQKYIILQQNLQNLHAEFEDWNIYVIDALDRYDNNYDDARQYLLKIQQRQKQQQQQQILKNQSQKGSKQYN